LRDLYARGLASHDYSSIPVDGTAAALAGLAQVHRQLSIKRSVAHAAI
jgi:hypothetical protein